MKIIKSTEECSCRLVDDYGELCDHPDEHKLYGCGCNFPSTCKNYRIIKFRFVDRKTMCPHYDNHYNVEICTNVNNDVGLCTSVNCPLEVLDEGE